jgi:hypothetical protein
MKELSQPAVNRFIVEHIESNIVIRMRSAMHNLCTAARWRVIKIADKYVSISLLFRSSLIIIAVDFNLCK